MKTNIDLNSFSLREYIPYLMNVKAIAGLVLIGYALYSAITDVPAKWQNYSVKSSSNNELVKNKNQLSGEETKLKLISKELDKFSTKILEVKPGNAPQLEAIKTAQKVIALSESSKNYYMGLEPGPSNVLNISSAVTLPIQVPGASASAGSPSKSSGSGSGETSTSTTDLNSFQYTLSLRGSYINLAKFIHNLVKLPDFIIINTINLTQAKETSKDIPNPDAKNADKPDIDMKLNFSVPWK